MDEMLIFLNHVFQAKAFYCFPRKFHLNLDIETHLCTNVCIKEIMARQTVLEQFDSSRAPITRSHFMLALDVQDRM